MTIGSEVAKLGGVGDANATAPRASDRRFAPVVSASLSIVYPQDARQVIRLSNGTKQLGREADHADVVVSDPTVSRKHVRLEWVVRKQAHAVTDLGSQNGTWINGQPVANQPVVLSDGDVVRIGDALAVYESSPEVDQADEDEELVDALPGRAAEMCRLRFDVLQVAADPSPVLLIGETGTGKEFVAREIHRRSQRSGPFLAVNCAALSPTVIESELFGHEKGAFTDAHRAKQGLFRSAKGGSLFLDEVGELPIDLQPKLLRALQEKQVRPIGADAPVPIDCRIIAATNRDLTEAVELGGFRRDLFARLSLWELRVPALRERRVDVLSWIDRLHRTWCKLRERNDSPLRFTADLAEKLILHEWPANLREVDRVVHRLAAAHGQAPLRVDILEGVIRTQEPQIQAGTTNDAKVVEDRPPPPKSREELEAVMAECAGSVHAVARYYKRDRRQIYRWLDSFGLRGR